MLFPDDHGWSAPVILGDQIWVTTATKDGKKMYAVCVSLETGMVMKSYSFIYVIK